MIKIAFTLLLFSNITFSLPDWIEATINKYNNPTVHKDASVLIILNSCEMQIRSNKSTESKYRKIVKILKEEAIFTYSFFELPTTKLDNVESFSAWIIRADGSEEEIDEEVLISMGPQMSSAYFYEDQNIYGIIPRLGVGSIIAFEFEIIEKGETCLFQEFVFQDQEPVISSRLIVQVPKGWELNYASLWLDSLLYTEGSHTFFWQCNNKEYELDEPLAPPKSFLQKKVIINCFDKENNSGNHFSSWQAASRWCNKYFIYSSEVEENIKSLSDDITSGCITNNEKLLAIAEFIQNNIRYVAIEIGKNKWIPRKAEQTLENRYGDCKDKTALMMAMLSSVGIKSYPVLVGALQPIFKSVTSPYQFNHVIIAIPQDQLNQTNNLQNAIYNNYLLFDPTSEYIDLGQIPSEICYSGALIGSTKGTDLFYLDDISQQEFMQTYDCNALVDSTGIVNCELELKFFNATASTIFSELKNLSAEEQKEFIEYLFSHDIPNLRISEMKNEKILDTLFIGIKLNLNNYIQKMDSIWVFKAQLISIPTLPVLKQKDRMFPIWFGAPHTIQTKTHWIFPQNFHCISDSSYIVTKIENSNSDFILTMQNNSAVVSSKSFYSGSLLHKEFYPEVIEYSKKLSEINNKVIVLKRNN